MQSTKPRKQRVPSGLTLDEYFWMHVDKNGPIPERCPERGPCWLWTGSLNHDGYGRIAYNGVFKLAHVHSAEIHDGSAPTDDLENVQRDHFCRVRNCVNYEHLDNVTRRENILRGNAPTAINARKTHCPKGHELTGRRINNGTKSRYCLTCNKERAENNYEKQKQAGLHGGSNPTAVNASKTHCIKGHPITGTKKNGNRYCVVCNRIASHDRYQALKKAKADGRKRN